MSETFKQDSFTIVCKRCYQEGIIKWSFDPAISSTNITLAILCIGCGSMDIMTIEDIEKEGDDEECEEQLQND